MDVAVEILIGECFVLLSTLLSTPNQRSNNLDHVLNTASAAGAKSVDGRRRAPRR